MDPLSFRAKTGEWVRILESGMASTQVAGSNWLNNKLVINNTSSYEYEQNDIKGGRVSTLERPGVIYQANDSGYAGHPRPGEEMVVSTVAASLGKLVSVRRVPSGTYEVVAKFHNYDPETHRAIFEIISPYVISR